MGSLKIFTPFYHRIGNKIIFSSIRFLNKYLNEFKVCKYNKTILINVFFGAHLNNYKNPPINTTIILLLKTQLPGPVS